MTKKFITFLAAALLLPAIAVAQNGVRYNYTHTDGVQYACSVYTDSINIDEATTGSVTHVVIPDSIPYGGTLRPVREVAANAFSYGDIESVVIPNTVTVIGYGAFSGCSMLETTTIGTGVVEIWETAFEYCESLTTLNYNAVSASVYAFSGSGVLDECDALSTINIGADVQSLPTDLVGSVFPLVSLTNVNIAAERLLPIASGYFGATVGGVSVTVPCSQLAAYQGDAVWSALGTITADCGSADDSTQTGDTTVVTVYDTVHVTVYDTVRITRYDTVVVDSVRYLDSVYCDTLVVHDTVYLDPQVGLAPGADGGTRVYVDGGSIVVEGAAEGERIALYDLSGRLLALARATGSRTSVAAPAAGAFLLRVGDAPAHKVVLLK